MTLITPGRGSREACTLAVAVKWKGGDRPRQATDCKSLSLGIFSRVLEGLTVTLKSSEEQQRLQPLLATVSRAESLCTVGPSVPDFQLSQAKMQMNKDSH